MPTARADLATACYGWYRPMCDVNAHTEVNCRFMMTHVCNRSDKVLVVVFTRMYS